MYNVTIAFKCFIGLKEINEVMRSCNLFEKNEGTGYHQIINISGAFSEIPDDAMLDKMAEILMNSFNESDGTLEMLSAEFESFPKIQKIKDS